jgi:glycosyltransferase involved in cell wall biosynthesis
VRVLISSYHRAVVGGTESYLRALVPALAARGHEVLFLHELEPAPGAPTIGDSVPRLSVAALGREATLRAVADFRPDVVYQHGLGDPGLEAALVNGFSSVLFAHGYYGTCVSGTKRFALPSVRPCTRTLGIGCLACYLPRRCGGLNPRTMMREYALQSRRLALARRYRSIAVASRHMRDEYLRHGIAPTQVRVVPLPCETDPDPAPPVLRARTDRVLLVGRLTPLKGGDVLVAAIGPASRTLGRQLQLVVAGEGGERPRLEALAASLGVPLESWGWVGPERRTELMRGADVLAVPSLWPEPFGVVGIEAGCVGLPAVGFATGGIPEWLEDGVSGELAPGDPPGASGLARALVRALTSPEHHARLREGAWRMAARYSMAAHLAALEPILS